MNFWLAYSIMLVLSVLISEFERRSILSHAVLFLVCGLILGSDWVGVLQAEPSERWISLLAEVTLFSVLFTDGMKLELSHLATAWRLPGRILLLGMPLSFVLTAILAHYVAQLSWLLSFLLSAILAPTDPVFASSLVGRESVPRRLRRLLNIESGLNDGLALPMVIFLLATCTSENPHLAWLIAECLGGALLGIAIPWIVLRLESSRFFSASQKYAPMSVVAIGLLVFALSKAAGVNAYLAAFFAGITVASFGAEFRKAFYEFGQLIVELLKLGSVMVFGALVSTGHLLEMPWNAYLFVLLSLILVRPITLGIVLWRSDLPLRQRAAAAWFGPKGFASVVYGLFVVNSNLTAGIDLFHLVAMVVTVSIVAHSSTDLLTAGWLKKRADQAAAN